MSWSPRSGTLCRLYQHAAPFSCRVLAVLGVALLSASASADILVLLPTRGPLAQAAQSIRDGLQAAPYAQDQYAPSQKAVFRFVDSGTASIQPILEREIKPDTQLVIGPLDRNQVAELVVQPPKVPVLTLNQVDIASPSSRVWQFALAPEQDARALIGRMQADQVRALVVYDDNAGASNRFRELMRSQWKGRWNVVTEVPTELKSGQGLLLLGNSETLKNVSAPLPERRVYAQATLITILNSRPVGVPAGVQWCDVSALTQPLWPELTAQHTLKPVATPWQRLAAFGGDARQLANLMLQKTPSAQFAGRTGKLQLRSGLIERTPLCLLAQRDHTVLVTNP